MNVRIRIFQIALSVFLLLGVSLIFLETQLPKKGRVREAIERGLDYLDRNRNSVSVFNDSYLAFRYQKSDLPGGLPESYPLSYRVSDALYQLVFLEEALNGKTGPIADIVKRAHRQINSLPDAWKYVRVSYEPMGDVIPTVALDTFCIAAGITKDQEMTRKIRNLLKNEGRWLRPRQFLRENAWRDVADESWCLMTLAHAGIMDEVVERAVREKFYDLENLRAGSYPGETGRVNFVGGLIHMVMLGQILEKKEHLPNFRDRFLQLEKELVDQVHRYYVRQIPSLLANILDVLLQSPRKKIREKAGENIGHLLSMQSGSGAFLHPALPETSPAFSTVRVLTALGRYLKATSSGN